MRRLIVMFCLCIMSITALATTPKIVGPWFTGPLLAPAGHTIPEGHVNYEPYFFGTDNYGFYNSQWKATATPAVETYNPVMILTVGLAPRMDFQISTPYFYRTEKNVSSYGYGDTTVVLGFQAINGPLHSYLPDLRVTIDEVFPTGTYKNLNPNKLGTDSFGSGSYQTGFGLNFQKLFLLHNGKYLRARLALIYTLPSARNIHGFNTYGGGIGTAGRIRPGNRFGADFSLEYTLTQHWVPAIDFAFNQHTSSSFSGNPGINPSNGMPAMVGEGSGERYSIAPAIEYNFNANVGVIAGVWFSVRGRNTADFASGVIAINIYH